MWLLLSIEGLRQVSVEVYGDTGNGWNTTFTNKIILVGNIIGM